MTTENEGQETPESEGQQAFTCKDGTVFHPYESEDGKARWRIGNEIISEEALLEFADDFIEDDGE